MVWLVTGKRRMRVVPGGRTMRERCPDCGEQTTLREVEIETSAGLFFVSVIEDTERLWQCTQCGETFELRDDEEAAALPPPRDLLAELERERAARTVEATRRDRKVDDELAALKKKLGK